MTLIYLDIETIPSQEPWVADYVAATVKPPGTIKKPESIDKWIIEESGAAIKDAMAKCSFDGCMNHVICIGYAIDNGDVQSLTAEKHADEAKIIRGFYDAISQYKFGAVFVGHNVTGFDLRVMRHRSIILGIKPPEFIPFSAKPWDLNPYDTMMQWDGKTMTGQDKIAKALGMEGKKDMDGKDVYPEWQAGNFDKIAAYCRDDVEQNRKIYKRMNFIGE